jgi:hypothetical protein
VSLARRYVFDKIGLTLIFGSILFLQAKREEFAMTSRLQHALDWSIVGAGAFYTISACILISFREEGREVHYGTALECQVSYHIMSCGVMLVINGTCHSMK